jgi:DNA-directed RNA polymerase subunit RPC12/RpoP
MSETPKEKQYEGSMRYKCNKCGDTFILEKQDIWSAFCFHCGKGLLQLVRVYKK